MFRMIRDILMYKGGKSLDREDFSEQFSPYLIQRGISMHSDLSVEILNGTVNILYKSLDDEQHFKLMMTLLPYTKADGKYIKVPKKDSKKKRKGDIDISATFEESSSKIEESLKLVLGECKKK